MNNYYNHKINNRESIEPLQKVVYYAPEGYEMIGKKCYKLEEESMILK